MKSFQLDGSAEPDYVMVCVMVQLCQPKRRTVINVLGHVDLYLDIRLFVEARYRIRYFGTRVKLHNRHRKRVSWQDLPYDLYNECTSPLLTLMASPCYATPCNVAAVVLLHIHAAINMPSYLILVAGREEGFKYSRSKLEILLWVGMKNNSVASYSRLGV